MKTQTSRTDMTDARKYLFDLAFDGDLPRMGQKKKEPEPTFTKEQLEAAKEDAYAQGFEAGRAKAGEEQQKHIEILLQNLTDGLTQTAKESGAFWSHQLTQLQQIILVIARKIIPTYTRKHGTEEIEAVVKKIMVDMNQEPRLVFRIPEDQFDAIKDQIEAIARQAAYAGKLVILGDRNLRTSECRVEWADGGIERDIRKLWRDIGQVMNQVHTVEQTDAIPELPEAKADTMSDLSEKAVDESPAPPALDADADAQTLIENESDATAMVPDALVDQPQQDSPPGDKQ